jgi:hypothetical protein
VRSERELKFGILSYLAERGRKYKDNALRPNPARGELEDFLGVEFDAQERARTSRAWKSLQRSDLIVSDYLTLSDPENWVEISDRGRVALDRHALDDLDEALLAVAARLVELRDEAWIAFGRGGDAALSQAVHSMCELVDNLLRALAPLDDVRSTTWFVPVRDSNTRVSRGQRARLIMERRHTRHDQGICDALVSAFRTLAGLKHPSKTYPPEVTERALLRAEDALREVLLWPTRHERAEGEAEE